jgi:hypothetical protein
MLIPVMLAMSVGGILAARALNKRAEETIGQWGINRFEHQQPDHRKPKAKDEIDNAELAARMNQIDNLNRWAEKRPQ